MTTNNNNDESYVSPSITDISDSSIDVDDDDEEEDESCHTLSPECSCSSLNSETASTIACTSDNTIPSCVPLVAVQDSPGTSSAASGSTSTASTAPIDRHYPPDNRFLHRKLPIPASIRNNMLHTCAASAAAAADDNLSESIATTTTEVDIDQDVSLRTDATPADTRLSPAEAGAWKGDSEIVRSCSIRSKRSFALSLRSSLRSGFKGERQKSASHGQLPHPHSLPVVIQTKPKIRIVEFIRRIFTHFKSSGIGEPSVYHALVVIFLEFFAWGLLTMPVIAVLNQTFPDHTFLMNGLVMGIKGILSFLSAPLIGALSDIWGRKFFLLITVFFTCAPIPLMTINTWWFFAMISISGVFAVTFSVVFAYVADVTTVEDRSKAYGLVSATFAASLVISPALGAMLMEMYSDTLVVALATAIAVLDVFFILVAVPESLPEKVRPSSWGAPISWEQADPFAGLRKVGTDHTILMQCVTVLLSYLPEAGQYSCIFVYLKLKMGFNSVEVSIFIAMVGILSIIVQVTLGVLMQVLGAKRTIILGLIFEMMQLLWYGFGSQTWMMWAAGVLAALGSVTYPAISVFVSIHSTADRQGAVQGMVTGMRGLCNGLGPAMFGVIFYLFNVDLNDEHNSIGHNGDDGVRNETLHPDTYAQLAPGPPFVFGAFMVVCAIMVAVFIPESRSDVSISRSASEKKRVSLDVQYEIECGRKSSSPLAPLMRSDSSAQL
ncbi:hippocampus abundant transcript 1 protein isoform X1 [Episyrphus balteatus]|uniref:hippocampus abundant transcript 1 protein isoform X1 n=1 Tax=Episyrphus balteatus TaxID=286459 RepID=UPI002485D25F|nr:hippocampus abundant transcript 1 protein isoform X1 [Episyrphus balteatus]XP_055844378.1 hippocampus abundant transcript 1 protein isoform X1 [Episyrphus balteatus]